MKKIITLLVGIVFSLNSFSQSWQWARAATGLGTEEGYNIAIDVSGNVFVTGVFYSSITFGTTTLTAGSGNFNMFLTKYDGAGNVLWARSASGTSDATGCGIATDNSGNIFVTGWFTSPAITFGTTTLTNAGTATNDIFLVKYDGAGNVLWAKSAGGIGNDDGYSAATDASGNVYLTGDFFSSTITFGSTTLANSSYSNVFLTKYDAAGNVLWATSPVGGGLHRGCCTATDLSGNVFVTGYYKYFPITFGTITLPNASSGSNGDAFLVKFDSSGNVLWATRAGGTGDDGGYGTATDNWGNVFVTGYFNSPAITFGATTFTNAGLGNYDFFLAKYDGTGNVLWAKSAGGIGYDKGYSAATDDSGNVYVSGGFSYVFADSIIFDSDTLLFPPGAADPMFLVKYDSAGSMHFALELASGGDDQNSVAVDTFGNVFIGGDFFQVNPFIVGTDSLLLTGTENIFVAKYQNASIGTGLSELTHGERINLSPNPATNELVVRSSEFGDKTEIEIYNTLGEKVYSQQQTTNDKQQTVDVSQLLPGVYFVAVTDDKGNKITRRFIKL